MERTGSEERVRPRRKAPGERDAAQQPEGRGPQRPGAGGGRGRALDPRQLGPRQRRGRARRAGVRAGHGARGPPGRVDAGPKPPVCSLGEAASFTVQTRSSQGHVCTGPAGCVCVSVSACVRVCAGRRAAAGGDPRRAPPPARRSHPRVFRPRRPGIPARPRPAPTLRRRHHRRPGSHGPQRGQGGARHDAPPISQTPPPPSRAVSLSAGRCAPKVGALLTPAAPPSSAGAPHPQPQVAGGGSRRCAPRPGPPVTPRPAPGGLPGPPPSRAEEAREPGGGAGGRVVPGCHFLPPPRSLRGARPPPPPPLPAGRGGGRLFRVGVRALQRAPAAGPRQGPGAGAEPGRRGRPGRGPCGSAEPGTAGRGRRWRGPPAALYGLELEPGAGRGRGGGSAPGAGRTGGGACRARGDINKPSNPPRRPGQPGPAVPSRSPGPAGARRRVAGVPGACPELGTARRGAPRPASRSAPASGPASRAASGGAHYRVAGRVGPARLRALVPRRRVPARPLLSPPPPPPARPPSRPARLPASLARSLPPSARCRAPSLRLLRRVPPSHPFSPPSSFPPSGRPRAQASARRSPPAAALAPAPALRSRPGRQRRLGGPGAARGGSGLGARPVLAPSARLCGPAGVPRTLRDGGPDPAAPRPTGRRDSGPSSPPAGVKCLPPQPAEPPAAFALQFSRPPPEPTALCLPQHWGWGQQRRSSPAATPGQVPPPPPPSGGPAAR
ncbi:collagen alpha-1(I) chain-like [Oryctolagus cuniculus]|uniref:collagen alpha-1(I) chain-like n=1 Tax=Oryctolagus cuniculus TaxID=9986 RepID=UPI0038792032